ncbi:MAG: hypothetical protein MUE96_00520 [Bacteroidia bacterium]|jgi:predicted anti-sigma-YlaC factor YlaD|nr:hypothetical protein [Bacteroidia bacterium]
MNHLNRLLFLSCKQATEAIEKGNTIQLSLLERARLNQHLKMCTACNMYAAFSNKAEIVIKQLALGIENEPEINETELQEKVLKKIFRK